MNPVAKMLLENRERQIAKQQSVAETMTHHEVTPIEPQEPPCQQSEADILAAAKDVSGMTTASIDNVLKSLADSESFDSTLLALPKRTKDFRPTKNDKAAVLERLVAVNNATSPVVAREVSYQKMSLEQLVVNPDNYRSEIDYLDPALYDAVKNSGSEGVKDIVVSADKIMCDDGVERYPIIAGNRTFSQHIKICDDDGLDPAEYKINVKKIRYSGDEKLAELQRLMDIAGDNNGSLQPSRLDKLKIAEKLMAYMTIQRAAKQVDMSVPMLKICQRVAKLPECILKHVDAHEKRAHYSKSLTKDQLDTFELNYYEGSDDDGNKINIVRGINFGTAVFLADTLLSLDNEEAKAVFLEYLHREKTIQNAILESSKDFQRQVKYDRELVDAGVFKSVAPTNATPEEVERKTDELIAKIEASNEVKEPKTPSTSLKSSAEKAAEELDKFKRVFQRDLALSYKDACADLVFGKTVLVKDSVKEMALLAEEQEDDIEFAQLLYLLHKFSLIVPK